MTMTSPTDVSEGWASTISGTVNVKFTQGAPQPCTESSMAYRYLTSVIVFSLAVVAPLSGCGDAQPISGGDTQEGTESEQGDLATVPNIGPDATAGVPVTPGAPDTSFAGQVASGVCAWLLGCCTTLEQEDFVASVTAGDTQTDTYALTLELRNDPAVCRELVKGHVLELWRDADSAVATGRAAYSDAATAACLASSRLRAPVAASATSHAQSTLATQSGWWRAS